ncbi:MAG: magnesium transporter [Rudaea sp.]|uniref:magnesium transporter n=1 Tax=Rudaea sp. TaxID=2136325 RepID=UPI0039E62087
MTQAAQRLGERIRNLDPLSAKDKLDSVGIGDADIAIALSELRPAQAIAILQHFAPARREAIAAAAPVDEGELWRLRTQYPQSSVGRLMESSGPRFAPQTTVQAAIDALRDTVRTRLVTYLFVVDADSRLVGVVTFREMLYAQRTQTLGEIMVRDPFSLRPETKLVDAMREVVMRHYPVYPVCDAAGRLVGQVRGQVLFEEQAFEISAQAGEMVGVEKEERTTTPWLRALKLRHPWLQVNLLTAFVSAAVVGYFQNAINAIVLLAVFLPVVSSQCSNAGCQTLAVTLRGMTLNELRAGRAGKLLAKEAWVGFLNGVFVGAVAALGMYVIARMQHNEHALPLALITLAATALSSIASGVAGAGVPMALKRAGADPAMASSIFLTTATDVVSMGLFLGLAQWWLM